jgi:hypothetical protein
MALASHHVMYYKVLQNHDEMNGRLKVYEWYFDQPYLEKKALSSVWSKEMVEQWITLAKRGKLGGNYGIIAIMSPQGLRASPYLPKPECSTELNVTIASNVPNVSLK